ncbi:hypothetical protein [uncultured Jannaschia sp.]|uniref:hypothetical protein n=1 Tax=uncultured Jannaschia sp. TaxID=293347 RepID=UPI002601986A|nr:hypothetical protein [uncultured Jannaschia sp.]
MRGATLLAIALLSACGGASAPVTEAAGPGLCPDPDPVRDGPYVDAIRQGDRATVEAALARDPTDPRALAARAIVTGRGRPDPAQADCFAPYLS